MIESNFHKIKHAIDVALETHNRNKDDVSLVAVSKKHPIEKIKEAFQLGQRDFGENFVQEGINKITALNNSEINWHYIGHIQSNKTRQISENFNWVHTIERIKVNLYDSLIGAHNFKDGALKAVNLGDDADTTGAVY